jgi:hypothetical protein
MEAAVLESPEVENAEPIAPPPEATPMGTAAFQACGGVCSACPSRTFCSAAIMAEQIINAAKPTDSQSGEIAKTDNLITANNFNQDPDLAPTGAGADFYKTFQEITENKTETKIKPTKPKPKTESKPKPAEVRSAAAIKVKTEPESKPKSEPGLNFAKSSKGGGAIITPKVKAEDKSEKIESKPKPETVIKPELEVEIKAEAETKPESKPKPEPKNKITVDSKPKPKMLDTQNIADQPTLAVIEPEIDTKLEIFPDFDESGIIPLVEEIEIIEILPQPETPPDEPEITADVIGIETPTVVEIQTEITSPPIKDIEIESPEITETAAVETTSTVPAESDEIEEEEETKIIQKLPPKLETPPAEPAMIETTSLLIEETDIEIQPEIFSQPETTLIAEEIETEPPELFLIEEEIGTVPIEVSIETIANDETERTFEIEFSPTFSIRNPDIDQTDDEEIVVLWTRHHARGSGGKIINIRKLAQFAGQISLTWSARLLAWVS